MRQQENINKAIKVFKKDGVVIFPTDTVWGIGCMLENKKAIRRLYKIKKREKDKPTAVLVGSIAQAEKVAAFDTLTKKLAKKFWPGGLTLVLKAKTGVFGQILGKGRTIGVRMPKHKMLLKVLREVGPIVAASANFAGQKAPKTLKEIDKKLIDKTDFLVMGSSSGGVASTVVDTTKIPIKIIRKGAIVSRLITS